MDSHYCETHDQAHVSECCGAQAIEDTDLCAKCRDHSWFSCIECAEDQAEKKRIMAGLASLRKEIDANIQAMREVPLPEHGDISRFLREMDALGLHGEGLRDRWKSLAQRLGELTAKELAV